MVKLEDSQVLILLIGGIGDIPNTFETIIECILEDGKERNQVGSVT